MSVLGVSRQAADPVGPMRVAVTRVGADGVISRGAIVADGSPGTRRWEDLILRAALGVPPPYEPEPGEDIYHVEAGDLAFLVGEGNLVGPLKELVSAVLASAVTAQSHPGPPGDFPLS